jgi:hypothetical protein
LALKDFNSPRQQCSSSKMMQNKAGIAGILSIVSGIFGVFWLGWTYFMTIWLNFMSKFADMHEFPSFSVNIYQLMSII